MGDARFVSYLPALAQLKIADTQRDQICCVRLDEAGHAQYRRDAFRTGNGDIFAATDTAGAALISRWRAGQWLVMAVVVDCTNEFDDKGLHCASNMLYCCFHHN